MWKMSTNFKVINTCYQHSIYRLTHNHSLKCWYLAVIIVKTLIMVSNKKSQPHKPQLRMTRKFRPKLLDISLT